MIYAILITFLLTAPVSILATLLTVRLWPVAVALAAARRQTAALAAAGPRPRPTLVYDPAWYTTDRPTDDEAG